MPRSFLRISLAAAAAVALALVGRLNAEPPRADFGAFVTGKVCARRGGVHPPAAPRSMMDRRADRWCSSAASR
jgi:hypothetical protein